MNLCTSPEPPRSYACEGVDSFRETGFARHLTSAATKFMAPMRDRKFVEPSHESGFVATPVKAWIRFAKQASPTGSPVFAVLRRGRRRQLRFLDREPVRTEQEALPKSRSCVRVFVNGLGESFRSRSHERGYEA